MFLDKLWLRIKGELILLKEDLSAGADIREKAAILLDKLEKRLDLPDSGSSNAVRDEERPDSRSSESEAPENESLDRIRHEYEDLVGQKSEAKDRDEETEQPPPNPRTLG